MTVWCNHLNSRTRRLAGALLSHFSDELERHRLTTSPASEISLAGALPTTRSNARIWRGQASWKGPIFLLAFEVQESARTYRISLQHDLRSRTEDDAQLGPGRETELVAELLRGFEAAAFDRRLLDAVHGFGSKRALLLRAAVYAFDPRWHVLFWSPGRGRQVSLLSLYGDRPEQHFGDGPHPFPGGRFSTALAQGLKTPLDGLMHIWDDALSAGSGVRIRIGPPPQERLESLAGTGAVELLRVLSWLPEDACLEVGS